MQDGIKRFEEFWREMGTHSRDRFVHPKDEPFVAAGPPGPHQLHLQVPPIPANGSIRHADIVLFMLNPNFDAAKDAAWRQRNPDGAAVLDECLAANLHQTHAPGARAFYDVRSDLKDSPGASYWKTGGGFAEIAQALAGERGYSLDDAYDEISRRVVVLQMVPYRSAKFGSRELIRKAPSSAHARELAHFLADETDKLLVIQRSIDNWGFSYPSTRANVVVYPKSQALPASLGLKCLGGRPILDRLLGNATALPTVSSAPPAVARFRATHPTSPPASTIPPARPLSAQATAPRAESWPPDRTDELRSIYEVSGLRRWLTSDGIRPPGKEPFSKLKFLQNDFKLSSMELYDLRNGERYLRIHYQKTAPAWLVADLASWAGFRNSNTSGSNFTLGDPLEYAKALARLLDLRTCAG
ncbi:hypothetical protein AB4Z46_02640 [Variovorax sp. M-6]|uniref:hypothetical protein n=1 Tax=Variovorax sp. M-6 TaxID=3233041 RepID=UPI003F9D7D12